MYKATLKLTIILILITCMCLILVACEKPKYPSGRDTFESFGDGTYQIYRGYIYIDQSDDSKSETRVYSLENNDSNETIENSVAYYLEIKQNIYIIGSEGYTVVNYESDEIIQETLLENIPKEHKVIFENKDVFKGFERPAGCN